MSEVLLFNPPRKYRRHNPIDAVGLAMAGLYPPVAKTKAKSRREVKRAKRLDDQIAKLLTKPSNTAKQKAKAQEQLARYYQQLANLASQQSMARLSYEAKERAKRIKKGEQALMALPLSAGEQLQAAKEFEGEYTLPAPYEAPEIPVSEIQSVSFPTSPWEAGEAQLSRKYYSDAGDYRGGFTSPAIIAKKIQKRPYEQLKREVSNKLYNRNISRKKANQMAKNMKYAELEQFLKENPPLRIYHGDNTMLCDNPRRGRRSRRRMLLKNGENYSWSPEAKKKLKKKYEDPKEKEALLKRLGVKKSKKGKKADKKVESKKIAKKESKKASTKKAEKKESVKKAVKSKKVAAKKSSKKSFALDFSGKYNKKAFSGSGTLKENPPTLKNQPVAFTSNVVAGAVVAQVGAPVLLRALGVSQKLGSQIAQGVLQNSQSARQVVSSFIGKRHALEAVSKVGLVLGVAGANKVVKNIAAGGNWYGTSGSIYRASDRYISGRAMFLGSLLSVAHSFFAFMRDKNMLDSLPDTPEQSGAARFLVMQVNDKSNAHIFTPQVQQQLAGAFQALITAGIQARKQGQAPMGDWMSMSDWVTVDNAMKQEADKDNQTNVQKQRKKQEMIRRKRSMRNYGMSDYVTMSDEDQEDYVGDYVTMSDEVISDEVISDEVISDEVISDEVISDEIYSDNNGTDSISDEDMEDEVISGHQESALFNAKWN